MRTTTGWPLVAGTVSLGLVACGTATGPGGSQETGKVTSGPTAVVSWLGTDGEVLVRCDGPGPAFPASLAEQDGLAVDEDQDQAIVRALAQLKRRDPEGPLVGHEAEDMKRVVLWKETDGGEDTLGLLVLPPDSPAVSLETAEHITLMQQDGRWTVRSWGGPCGARPALPEDSEWAHVALSAETPSAESTVKVLVLEIQCTSARDPDPFLASEPVLVETDGTVTVY